MRSRASVLFRAYGIRVRSRRTASSKPSDWEFDAVGLTTGKHQRLGVTMWVHGYTQALKEKGAIDVRWMMEDGRCNASSP